ncbi:MAG: acyl-CoA dehydrogenase, partial [Bacteroidetes bacterium]|nr:acyl-CoA dehydrogenase [Bacteroidota bacterium]
HAHYFKMASKWYKEEIVTRQAVQARLGDAATYLFAMAATLSRFDRTLSENGAQAERDRAFFVHALDLLENRILNCFRELKINADDSMMAAAAAGQSRVDALPDADFYIHESSPTHHGKGRKVRTDLVPQFPGVAGAVSGDGAPSGAPVADVKSGLEQV